MKYIVIELQKSADGTVAHLVDKYDSLEQAYSKFFSILSYAAVSTLPKHSAVIFNEEGYVVDSRFFTHEQEENNG